MTLLDMCRRNVNTKLNDRGFLSLPDLQLNSSVFLAISVQELSLDRDSLQLTLNNVHSRSVE